jgi:TonB family protein
MIKASIIPAIAYVLTFLMRRRPAAEHHIVWVAAIFSSALLPVLSLVMPSWQPAFAARFASSLPRVLSRTDVDAGGTHGTRVVFQAQSIQTTAGTLERALPFLWLAGAIVCLLFIARALAGRAWIRSRSVDCGNGRIQAMLSKVGIELRCRRTVRIEQSIDECTPMTWGAFRPCVLLPRSAEHWPDSRIRVVLAHELAHVQRMDWLVQTVVQAVCVLYWFNPLFWMAANRMHRESERACDDAVLRLGVDARDYATHLLEIARAFCQPKAGLALAMARQSSLEKRFAALLRLKMNREAIGFRKITFVAVAALCVVIPLAALQLSGAASAANRSGFAAPMVDQYTTPPLYSDEARTLRIEGKVVLEVIVGVDGKPRELHVIRGLGFGLDQNALVAVRDWHFVPAMRNGIPVESPVRVDVEFSLKTAELNESIANDMATRIGPGVTPPQVVYRSDPIYPANAPGIRTRGDVVLDAIIPEDGISRVIRVIRSLNWQFDESAINALKQWRFSPAMKDGTPVKVRMNVAVEFTPTQ